MSAPVGECVDGTLLGAGLASVSSFVPSFGSVSVASTFRILPVSCAGRRDFIRSATRPRRPAVALIRSHVVRLCQNRVTSSSLDTRLGSTDTSHARRHQHGTDHRQSSSSSLLQTPASAWPTLPSDSLALRARRPNVLIQRWGDAGCRHATASQVIYATLHHGTADRSYPRCINQFVCPSVGVDIPSVGSLAVMSLQINHHAFWSYGLTRRCNKRGLGYWNLFARRRLYELDGLAVA